MKIEDKQTKNPLSIGKLIINIFYVSDFYILNINF